MNLQASYKNAFCSGFVSAVGVILLTKIESCNDLGLLVYNSAYLIVIICLFFAPFLIFTIGISHIKIGLKNVRYSFSDEYLSDFPKILARALIWGAVTSVSSVLFLTFESYL